MTKINSIIQFIRDHYQIPSDIVPLHAPLFDGNEKTYLADCIDSTYVSSVGRYVNLFEEKVAEYTNAKHTVACVNGTSALHLALLLAEVKQNDEVITQALTFVATPNAISYCGAQPIFIDVDLKTMGLSPIALKDWLNNNATIIQNECYNKITNKRIKACVPMHTLGHSVEIEDISRICEEWHIVLIEDAAESFGSFYKGKHTGTFGKIGVLSFNGNKILTTGGGGMLLINDDELAHRAKHLTTQAKIEHPWNFEHDEIGYNYRMPNINAAIGCAQMEYLSKTIENKRETAKAYHDFFKSFENIHFFDEPVNCISNFWLNTIIFENKTEQQKFLKTTNESGIMTRPIWELMSNLPMYQHCQKDDLKNSIWFSERVVNIPSSVR